MFRILPQGPITIKMQDGLDILVGVISGGTMISKDYAKNFGLNPSIFAHRDWIKENSPKE